MALSVRLDPETSALVDRLARRRRTSKSEVVRDALSNLERQHAARGNGDTFHDAIEHLIGCVDTGRGDLSEDTGAKFRTLLRETRRGRRSR